MGGLIEEDHSVYPMQKLGITLDPPNEEIGKVK